MGKQPATSNSRMAPPLYDRNGDGQELAMSIIADRESGKRLRIWLILANLAAWIVIAIVLKLLIF